MRVTLQRLKAKTIASATLATSLVALVALPAGANTSYPTSIKVMATTNGNGSVTVNVSGDWVWPAGMNCAQRYGTGISVGWWGIGSGATPTKNVSLTNASKITAVGQGINGSAATVGSITSTGAMQFDNSEPAFAGKYFYVGDYYSDSTIFTSAFCNASQPGGSSVTTAFSGKFNASATYPTAADVPAQICVNTYDEHGTQGKPTAGPGGALSNDFDPSADADNAIKQQIGTVSEFNTPGATSCGTTTFGTDLPQGGVAGIATVAGFAAVLFAALQVLHLRRRRQA